jgi:hypothetical protein
MQDVDTTIISQYATAFTIVSLIEAWDAAIDPGVDLDAFYAMIWDLDTAQGIGLDIWGRIVGVGRVLSVSSGTFFGYAEPADPSESPFNTGGPLFPGGATTTNFALTDDGFRTLIYAKALANITNGSIPALNQILLTLFPGRGNCYVVDNGDMTMIFHFAFSLSAVEMSIVQTSGVLPKPAGVAVSVVQGGS